MKYSGKTTKAAATTSIPWFIDAFLFPLNGPGLTMLTVLFLGPIIITLIGSALGFFGAIMFGFFFLARLVFILYTVWYLGLCIEDSADGQNRAPSVFTHGQDDGLGEMFIELIRFVVCILLCLAPAQIYRSTTEQVDATFWIINLAGLFLLPMMLLAVRMHESLAGLNPILIIVSILKTHISYCAVVLAFFIPITAIHFIIEQSGEAGLLVNSISSVATLYLMFVACHILGRFYCRKEARLDWF